MTSHDRTDRALFDCVEKNKTKLIGNNHSEQSKQRFTSLSANENSKRGKKNANDKVAIVFSFASDWSKGSREFSKPIIVKIKQNEHNLEYFRHVIENCSIKLSETNVEEEEMLFYIKRYLDKEIGNLWQVIQGVFRS